MRAITTSVLVACMCLPAMAQSRYDSDQAWVRETIHKERRAERRRQALVIEYREQRRIRHRPRHQHDNERTYRKPRVYGYVAMMSQQDRRDCHGGCCPPVENISRDHGAENRAWNDAQLGWMKAVAVRYGAMYADVQNVDARTLLKQCFRSSFDESWIGRNKEALAQNTGIGDGFKWTCRIIASPCIQPIQGANDTRLKGDAQ